MNIGDTIKCRDKDDMVDTMQELTKNGIITDFLYEKDGVKGLWLVVEEIERGVTNEWTVEHIRPKEAR